MCSRKKPTLGNHMSLEQVLQEFGLGKNKGTVYVTLLEMGSGTVQQIASKTNIARTTVHEIVQHLLSLGLVGFTTVGRGRVYIAEPPKKLLSLQKEREEKIKKVLPELELMFNTGGLRPKIRFYEGAEGVKSVFDDTLTVSNKVLHGILSMEDLYDVPGKTYMDRYVQRRVDANIKLQVIRTESKEVEENWPSSKLENREVRYNPSYLIFPMTVYLYDNKVCLLGTKKEHFGMIIESPDFYRTMKNLYDILWDLSKKIRPTA